MRGEQSKKKTKHEHKSMLALLISHKVKLKKGPQYASDVLQGKNHINDNEEREKKMN